MAEKRVVLVDGKSLANVKEALTKAGYKVVSCGGAFDALKELATDGAHLIVLPGSLPDMSGYQLSCLLKTSEQTRLLPIILVAMNDKDAFWSSAAMADSLLEIKDSDKVSDKIVTLAKELIETAEAQGWAADAAKHALSPDLKSTDKEKSYAQLVDLLLLDRLVAKLIRNLLDCTESKRRFSDGYLATTTQLFNHELIGVIYTLTQVPSAVMQVADGTTRKALLDVIRVASEKLAIKSEISLDVRGQLSEEDGPAMASVEVLPITYGKQTLGGLVFARLQKDGFDSRTRALMGNLKGHIIPAFKLLAASQEIELLHQKEQHRASTDALTGLYNLEFLVGFLQQQLLFSYRQRSPVGLIIIDIDSFKHVNEQYGYEIGDLVLSTIANRLLNLTRSSDLIARYGGDQFAIVLPNTDVSGARVLAEKVRLEIEQMSFVKGPGRKGPHVTVSIGCSSFNMEDLNPETILRDAKMALLKAKEAGRNKVAT